MNIGILASLTRKISGAICKNSPAILTACATGGVIFTAVSSGKAVIKARDIITAHDMDEELKEEVFYTEGGHTEYHAYYRQRTLWEKTKLTWRVFVPPVIFGSTTICCIVGANSIHTKRNLALATAYALSEESAREFKEKVREKLGEKKLDKIEHEINQDRVNSTFPNLDMTPTIGYGAVKALFRDNWSGQFFWSYRSYLDKMECEMDRLIKKAGGDPVKINEWYDLIGLEPDTKFGDIFGWVWNGDPLQETFKIDWDYCEGPDHETHCAIVDFQADLFPY